MKFEDWVALGVSLDRFRSLAFRAYVADERTWNKVIDHIDDVRLRIDVLFRKEHPDQNLAKLVKDAQ